MILPVTIHGDLDTTHEKRWGYIKGDVNYKKIAEEVYLTRAAARYAVRWDSSSKENSKKHRFADGRFLIRIKEEYINSLPSAGLGGLCMKQQHKTGMMTGIHPRHHVSSLNALGAWPVATGAPARVGGRTQDCRARRRRQGDLEMLSERSTTGAERQGDRLQVL